MAVESIKMIFSHPKNFKRAAMLPLKVHQNLLIVYYLLEDGKFNECSGNCCYSKVID